MEGKTHHEFLPTVPGTQVIISTDKPWCAGHARWPWWLHHAGHRLRLLRVKSVPPFPRGYVDG